MTEDAGVVLAVYGVWGLGLLGLYGLACLAEWAGRVFWGIDLVELWDRWSQRFLGGLILGLLLGWLLGVWLLPRIESLGKPPVPPPEIKDWGP